MSSDESVLSSKIRLMFEACVWESLDPSPQLEEAAGVQCIKHRLWNQTAWLWIWTLTAVSCVIVQASYLISLCLCDDDQTVIPPWTVVAGEWINDIC